VIAVVAAVATTLALVGAVPQTASAVQAGDFVVSIQTDIDASTMGNLLATTLPESLGLPDGSSPYDIMVAEYNVAASAEGDTPVPYIPDAQVFVNDGSVELYVPVADFATMENNSGAWVAFVSWTSGFLAGLATLGVCVIALAGTVVGPFFCPGIAGAITALVTQIVTRQMTGAPFDANAWQQMLVYSLFAGLGAAAMAGMAPWMLTNLPGIYLAVANYISNTLRTMSGWIGASAVAIAGYANTYVLAIASAFPAWFREFTAEYGLPTPGNTGPVSSGMSNKCMDDHFSSAASGNPVDLWDCNGTDAQAWTSWSDGRITIFGKCLDIVGNGTGNGTPVDLWDCNGGGNQVWVAQYGGLYNPQSGRCLDDTGWSTDNGTQLEIWDCSYAANQQWALS
jgi:hypothetical protein